MFERATAKQHRVQERLKALGELKAAALVNCEFCVDIASSEGRKAGVSDEQMLALPRYRESDLFDELEKLVLDYAVAISSTPTRVSDELFAALREHFDERQLVELTNVIVLENMRARFNSAFDMTPARFSEGMVCIAMETPPAEVAQTAA
jgi:AhpD family alkylhydroperoxidase